ncbi:MFS transporter [Chloroflexota bacterium]
MGIARMDKKAFFILATAIFGSMLGQGIVTPFLPLYAQTMGASGIWIGIIFGAFSFSRLMVMPFSGPLSDRTGRKWFLTIGLAGYAIVSLGYIMASNLYYLVLVRFVQGAASAVVLPIARAYIGDLCPKGEEGKWTGYTNAAFFSGLGAGPLIGGVLSDLFGQNSAFFTMGALNLMALLLIFFLLPEIKPKQASKPPNLLVSVKAMSTSKAIWGLLSYRTFDAMSRSSFFTFLAIFAYSVLNLSQSLIGILLATHMGTMALSGPYWGNVADRFSRRTMIITGGIITSIFFILIPMMSNWWPLLLLCAFGGLGIAMVMPPLEAMAIDEGRKYGMGTAMSMLMVAMSIGMAIGPTAAGAVYDNVDINWVFYFCTIVGSIGTILFYLLTRQVRQTTP